MSYVIKVKIENTYMTAEAGRFCAGEHRKSTLFSC